jgi:hypothetical protein
MKLLFAETGSAEELESIDGPAGHPLAAISCAGIRQDSHPLDSACRISQLCSWVTVPLDE